MQQLHFSSVENPLWDFSTELYSLLRAEFAAEAANSAKLFYILTEPLHCNGSIFSLFSIFPSVLLIFRHLQRL